VKTRGAASAILVGAVLLTTTGCGLFAPQATLIQYEPSDGTAGTVSDVDVRNVIALSEDGTDVSLVFTAINPNDRGLNITAQFTDGAGEKKSERFYVPANSSASFGGVDDDETVLLQDVDVVVGSLLPVYLQFGDEPGTQLQVPVLDGSLPEYEDLVPDVEEAAE
jgi:hypothetical protein